MTTVAIIGGGPAGIEAALTAAQAGASVTLINDGPLGGRAGWHSLLPSKVWLTAADIIGAIESAVEAGVLVGDSAVDNAAILARISAVKESWNSQQAAPLHQPNIQLYQGTAQFTGPRTLEITQPQGDSVIPLQADAIIVTAGSVPRFPAGLKPDGKRVLAPRFASKLEPLPASVVVIGAGATGCEFAYLFNRLGTAVTWVVGEPGVMAQLHPAAGAFLGESLVAQGVTRVDASAETIERSDSGVVVVLDDGSRITAEMAFVAVGRLPDWSRLALETAGIVPEDGQIQTDSFGRSVANPAVYMVGDAAGGWLVANKAMAQARVAARHAAGLPARPYRPETVVLATYTEPQLAQVGSVEEGDGIVVRELPFSAVLKAHLLPHAEGFFKLMLRESDARVLGAVAAGPHAADVVAPVALAIQLGASAEDLADVYPAHPTLSELAFAAARLQG